MRKVGVVAPGHFVRLGPEVGFFHAWHEASKLDEFPVPDYATGVSAGGIAAACAAQWDDDDFKRVEKILIDLKGSDFYGLNPNLEVWGGLTALTAISTLLPWEKIERMPLRYILKIATVLGALGVEERFVKKLFSCESIFHSKLEKLLLKPGVLNFDRIFKSPLRVEIIATDVNENVADITTNFRSEHQNKNVFTRGLVNSTTLPGFFPFWKNQQGHYIADGAGVNNIPLNFAMNFGCDVIVVLDFNCSNSGPNEKAYDQWMGAIQRFLDIVIDDNARRTIEGCQRINNDLEQGVKIEQAIKILGTDSEPTLAETEAVTLLKDVRLSAFGKRKVKLIVVASEPIPEFHFSDFTRNNMLETINIGYRAFHKSKKEILKAVLG